MTEPGQTDTDPVGEMISILDLERIEVNRFRGHSPKARSQRVFGGQVIGQALTAAYHTVEDRVCHSLHAYFIRPGDPTIPILYEVDQSRDGRSFTTRRVVAIQHGKQIFNLAASFQIDEAGYEHQFDMPDVPMPEDLKSENDLRAEIRDEVPERFRDDFLKPRPIEIRPIDPQNMLKPKPMPPYSAVWFRAARPFGDEVAMQQSVLAYASDMTLLDTCTRPHAANWFSGKVQMASLDHAMWFHGAFKAEDWLLYTKDSPSASGARGFNRGTIYTRDGRLIASVAQEGLIRPVDKNTA